MTFKPASSALSHFKVLDLTRARAGPTAARQLADFGADVIKIETPGDKEYGDLGTRQGPDFQNLHRNKRGITLNLKSSEGLEIFLKLVKEADVVIENYRPDVKRRLKIDYEDVRAVNPRIVYASISGFGQTGPYANRPGLDQIAQGMGGHMSVTGPPGSGPWRSGTAISDLSAGLLAATGVLAALLERDKSGEGQWLHTSLLEAQIFLMDFQAARWLMSREVPPQVGNNHPTNVPMGTFKTKDSHVNIAPMSAMWGRFCKAIGLETIEADPKFSAPSGRTKNRKELFEIIEAQTIKETSSYWIKRLNDAGVPCGPIYQMDEVFKDEQVKHLGIAKTVNTEKLGAIDIVGQPLHLERTKSSLVAGSPALGQHTEEVLLDIGYSVEEISDLRKREVI